MSEFPRACNVFGCVQPVTEGAIHCRYHQVEHPKDDLQRVDAVAGPPPEVGIADLLRKRDDSKLAALEARVDLLEDVLDEARRFIDACDGPGQASTKGLRDAIDAADKG